MKKRRAIPVFIYVLVLALIFSLVSTLLAGNRDDLAYSDLVRLFEAEEVQSFYVSGDTIVLNLYHPYQGKTELKTTIADSDAFRREMWDLIQAQRAAGILES